MVSSHLGDYMRSRSGSASAQWPQSSLVTPTRPYAKKEMRRDAEKAGDAKNTLFTYEELKTLGDMIRNENSSQVGTVSLCMFVMVH